MPGLSIKTCSRSFQQICFIEKQFQQQIQQQLNASKCNRISPIDSLLMKTCEHDMTFYLEAEIIHQRVTDLSQEGSVVHLYDLGGVRNGGCVSCMSLQAEVTCHTYLIWLHLLSNHLDSLHQVCRLGVVLLGVYHESLNMYLSYTFYTSKVHL